MKPPTYSALNTASPVADSFLATGSNLNCFLSSLRTGSALVATDDDTFKLASTTGKRSGSGSSGCSARLCKHYTSQQNAADVVEMDEK